jgi:hypothetical protein
MPAESLAVALADADASTIPLIRVVVRPRPQA